jgi:hypothetical protein
MTRKTAVAERPVDPVAARIEVLGRVKARRPADRTRSYPNLDGGEPVVTRIPPDADRFPPRDLEQWCDDRELGAFGGRIKLNDAEAAAHSILTSMRTGDPAEVRRTVSAAGKGVDAQVRYLISGLLEQWRGGAPVFALDVAIAAVGEARRLGWDRRPRKTRRGPEPLDQTPGRRVA